MSLRGRSDLSAPVCRQGMEETEEDSSTARTLVRQDLEPGLGTTAPQDRGVLGGDSLKHMPPPVEQELQAGRVSAASPPSQEAHR